jgi:hypothetical protein
MIWARIQTVARGKGIFVKLRLSQINLGAMAQPSKSHANILPLTIRVRYGNYEKLRPPLFGFVTIASTLQRRTGFSLASNGMLAQLRP